MLIVLYANNISVEWFFNRPVGTTHGGTINVIMDVDVSAERMMLKICYVPGGPNVPMERGMPGWYMLPPRCSVGT